MRTIIAIAVIAAALFASYTYTPHHTGSSVFETLYFHLVPAPLKLPAKDHAADEEHESADEHAGSDEHAGADGDAAEEDHAAAGSTEHPSREIMLEVPLPGFLGFMDYRGQTPEGESPKTALFNLQIFQVAAVLLVLILFSGIAGYVRTGRGSRITRILTGWAMWVRDDMVYPAMGKEMGRKFLPYFLSIFFFVLFMNLMGLIPLSATPTASIFVTAALALTTLMAMVGCGMAAQGPIAFWKNLVPHVPLALWPLMFVVELLGLFVKPFALMIRLFANMSGGHMVVLSFMGLIFFMAGIWGDAGGWGTAPIGVAFAVFIMIIEAFVAMVQAFIFTQLSILFVAASVHPEH
ncbi:MAG: F-type H+-transporting ATPase subunit a [Planctomycetota bacterium]|jgi:F-type H+-transporting ATPase subunit a